MPISKTIADFASALDAARVELASVNARIDELEAERRGIANAPPHTDDITAVFMRGLRASSDTFTRQFAARLNEKFVGADGVAAAAAAKGASADLITLDAEKPDREAILTRSMQGQAPDLNIAVLTYFLGDRIAAELPALVDKLCPSARTGMKQTDRERALQEVDNRLVEMRIERDRLAADLSAARAAVVR